MTAVLLLLALPCQPAIVAHRGLLRDAPENTLRAFAACLELRIGFELDVRRTKDGTLVCVHDDTLDRTTDGKGRVADTTLRDLKRLDAGKWFDPAFAGERVPTLDEVFALVKARGDSSSLVAIDLKIDDGKVEAETVALAKKHGVLGRLVFIGTAIDGAAVRKRLLDADPDAAVAVLANRREEYAKALDEKGPRWAYVRFLPTREEVQRAHKARKKLFVVGKLVAGPEPKNWRTAGAAGVDAVLTDHPLALRRALRLPLP